MKFKENIILSQFSSYKIGGPARYFFDAKNIADLRRALEYAEEKKLVVFVLGGGTNLLINDKGFDGLVIKSSFDSMEISGERIRAGAGVLMEDLLGFAIKHGFSGLEWAGGLPGTLGGAIRGNAGAFGGEIKDNVETVESFDIPGFSPRTRDFPECRFGYRSSIFKERNGEEVVLATTLKLAKGDSRKIKKATQEKIDYRLSRHPMEYPNIGSIFKNVDLKLIPKEAGSRVEKAVKTDPFPVVPTAYLISEVGLKGVSYGGAMISPKHPNFIVNVLGATCSDVQSLILLAKAEVKKEFGIELEQEVESLSAKDEIHR